MMKISFVYEYPRIYNLMMKLLYLGHYEDRFKVIAGEIPAGSKVLDVCCGDCELYKQALKGRVHYTGVDINPRFVERARKQSIDVFSRDVRKDELPPADFVVMQASLYQFIPNHKQIVDKLLDSATEKAIISEPVRNLSDSDNPIVSFIAQRLGNPGTGDAPFRFTEGSFRKFLKNNYNERIEKFKFIPGGRELIAVLKAKK